MPAEDAGQTWSRSLFYRLPCQDGIESSKLHPTFCTEDTKRNRCSTNHAIQNKSHKSKKGNFGITLPCGSVDGDSLVVFWLMCLIFVNFEINLDLEKSCKNSTESSHILFTPFLLPLTFYIAKVH